MNGRTLRRAYALSLAVATLAPLGCSKGDGAPPPPPPPPPPAQADVAAPIVVAPERWTVERLDELLRTVEQKDGIADPAERTRAMAQAATALVEPLLAAQTAADADPGVPEKAAALLVRLAGFVEDPAQADVVARQVLLPALAGTAPPIDPRDPRIRAADAVAGLAARLTPERAGEALTALAALAGGVREAWACKDRAARVAALEPVAAHEAALVAVLHAVGATLLRHPPADAASAGLGVLVDALRESPDWQDAAVHEAAIEAAGVAGVGPEAAPVVAPALVEALFLPAPDPAAGDRASLRPWVRRALVRIARAGEAQRDVVVGELWRALLVDPADGGAGDGEPPGVEPNENVALRTRACGRALGVACAAGAEALRGVASAAAAPCNQGKDAAQDDGGFDPGLAAGRVWEEVGDLLIDVLPIPVPDGGPSAGVAAVLSGQVRSTDEWAVRVQEARAFHESLLALYPAWREDAALAAVSAPAPAAGARRGRAPGVSAAVKPTVEAVRGLLSAEGAPLPVPEARAAAGALIAALGAPEAKAADREVAAEVLRPFALQVRAELLGLADYAGEYAAVQARWRRTVAAARTLGRLGFAGADDANLLAVLRVARFALDDRAGFPVTVLRAFPAARLAAEATAGGARSVPAVGPLLDAVRGFARPSAPALNFLLHVVSSSGLDGENPDAAVAAGRFGRVDPELAAVRLLAARAFFALWRDDPALPDAARYAALFRFHARELQVLFALEQGAADRPPFALFPPPGAAARPDDWTAAPPPRPQEFRFETYADALASCVLRPREAAEDVDAWTTDMTDDDREAYCSKWVEPFASQAGSAASGEDVPRLGLADERCWEFMGDRFRRRGRDCAEPAAGSRPGGGPGMTAAECRGILDAVRTEAACVALARAPEYPERGRPTLWGCYDRFPWLRLEEPLGPACPSLAGRLLAAWLYVKLRSEAGIAAEDGVSAESLAAILPLEDYLRTVATFAARPDAEALGRLERLADELAKVQLDFPVFRRPPSPEAEVVRTGVRRPAGFVPARFVVSPWYGHEEWVLREARTFADLRASFRQACRAESDAPTAPCAADGGRLRRELQLGEPAGTPDVLAGAAASLAALLRYGAPGDLAAMADVVAEPERCERDGALDAACLAEVAAAAPVPAEPADAFRRARALFRLAAPAPSDAAMGEPLCSVAAAPGLGGDLRPVLDFALRRARPVCAGDASVWDAVLDPRAPWLVPGVPGPFADAGAAAWWPAAAAGGGPAEAAAAAADVVLGQPTVTGVLDADVARRLVAQQRGRLVRCYQAALRAMPALRGRMTLRFAVAAAGGVETLEVLDNGTGDDRLAECVQDTLRAITFPERDAPTEITFPMEFAPAE